MIAVELSILNEFAVRHFAIDFSSKTFFIFTFFILDFCHLTFNRQIFFFAFIAVVYFPFGVETSTIDFFFTQLLAAVILAVSYLLCSFSSLDILLGRFLHAHFSLSDPSPDFLLWGFLLLNVLDSEQLFVLRLFVTKISSFCPSFFFNNRLYTSHF